MTRWLFKHWRDVPLIVLLIAIGAVWNDALRDAKLEGLVSRCRWLPW